MSSIDRDGLKAYFITGAIPSQSHFADFIDSTVNVVNDGIAVSARKQFGIGTPSPSADLSVQSQTATPLSGTVTTTAGSPDVTGTGTLFMTELAVGDAIKIDNVVYGVNDIGGDKSLTLSQPFPSAQTDLAAFRDGQALSLSNGLGSQVLSVDRNGNLALPGGSVTAVKFVGSGAGLTGLTPAQIPDLDASKITTGKLSPSVLPDNGNTGSVLFYATSTTIDGTDTVTLNWKAGDDLNLVLTYPTATGVKTLTIPPGQVTTNVGGIYNDTVFTLTASKSGATVAQPQIHVSVVLTLTQYLTFRNDGTALADILPACFSRFNLQQDNLVQLTALGAALVQANFQPANIFKSVGDFYHDAFGVYPMSVAQIKALNAGVYPST